MEKALSAYTDEHILRYLNDVKTNGLTEHGFPRLTANIGILIAHGRRKDLLPLFMEMMDVCCDMFLRPYVKSANEFSVREIVCCIDEIEKAKAVEKERILHWKRKISQIVPESCYNVVVKEENDRITNWAIFGAVSEYARFYFGLGETLDFVDRQLSCQFQWLDENGMYRDNPKELIHQPIMYDYVSRGLFAMLLHWGYRGKYYESIDACLKRAGLLTLKMQSPNGEIPFGVYGCEGYAYFDKYMITAASNLYAAYLLCDDSIPTEVASDHESVAFQTSYHFHKLFLKSGGYALEFDTNADPHHDANGLGRIHREGAPSTICLSCPCPAEPGYTVDIETPFAFSMCSAIREKDGWHLGTEESATYKVLRSETAKDCASATLLCKFSDDHVVKEHYTVNEGGVSITLEGDGEIGYTIPAFCFDGEVSPQITVGEHSLTVSYEGWVCRYTTNEKIEDLKKIAANRNGHYRAFHATAQNTLNVKIEITKA